MHTLSGKALHVCFGSKLFTRGVWWIKVENATYDLSQRGTCLLLASAKMKATSCRSLCSFGLADRIRWETGSRHHINFITIWPFLFTIIDLLLPDFQLAFYALSLSLSLWSPRRFVSFKTELNPQRTSLQGISLRLAIEFWFLWPQKCLGRSPGWLRYVIKKHFAECVCFAGSAREKGYWNRVSGAISIFGHRKGTSLAFSSPIHT